MIERSLLAEYFGGCQAGGGSPGDPGFLVASGMLYVGSGYIGTGNGIAGKVLPAFAAQ
jgi:hypothetical protein